MGWLGNGLLRPRRIREGVTQVKKGHIFLGFEYFFQWRERGGEAMKKKSIPLCLSAVSGVEPSSFPSACLCVAVVGDQSQSFAHFHKFPSSLPFFLDFAAPFLFPPVRDWQVSKSNRSSCRLGRSDLCVKVRCPSQLKLGPRKSRKTAKSVFLFSLLSVAVINNSEKPGHTNRKGKEEIERKKTQIEFPSHRN